MTYYSCPVSFCFSKLAAEITLLPLGVGKPYCQHHRLNQPSSICMHQGELQLQAASGAEEAQQRARGRQPENLAEMRRAAALSPLPFPSCSRLNNNVKQRMRPTPCTWLLQQATNSPRSSDGCSQHCGFHLTAAQISCRYQIFPGNKALDSQSEVQPSRPPEAPSHLILSRLISSHFISSRLVTSRICIQTHEFIMA